MDVLRAQLARMQQQLSQLSASQRMLAFSLVALMVLTLLFWGRYASTADMEAVLDQSLKPDEIARITSEISRKGIQYKIDGGRILVPADRKLDVLADLSYLQLVPRDTRAAYDEILKRVNPWSSSADNDATRIDAKAALLSQIISKFPGVRSADVVIDPTNERRLGGGGRKPVATAIIMLEDQTRKKPDRGLADAVAATIMGAQSGLETSRITITVNGARFIASDRESLGVGNADEILTKQQESEAFFTQKISQQLNWFGAVMVAVTCDVNVRSEQSSEDTYDAKNAVSKEKSTQTETSEQTEAAPPQGEPGAIPNAPLSVNGSGSNGSASGTGSNKERTTSQFENFVPKKHTDSVTPAGKSKVLAATVRLPRSYFVSVYKMSNPTAQSEPDDVALKTLVEAEIPKVRRDVRSCTAITSDDDIVVDTYPDVLPMLAAVGGGIASAKPGNNISSKLGEHYKEIGIALLAVISLFMVSSMVKKSTPVPVMAAVPSEPVEPETFEASEPLAGEAVEGGGTLDGMELDDDSVKAQQMVEQVATMVKENPDAAANLVKRWLNRT
jgi:flagellar biosynthesis/type III secretory pathway M-ring protein FliF/YscJ